MENGKCNTKNCGETTNGSWGTHILEYICRPSVYKWDEQRSVEYKNVNEIINWDNMQNL